MRGRPLKQWFLFLIAWSVLLVPIIRVTRQKAMTPETVVEESDIVTAWASLRFSSPPGSFALYQESELLWQDEAPSEMMFEREIPVRFDPYGVGLRLVTRLPETTTAVELTLEADGRSPRSRTLWVSGDVDEAVEFAWKAHHGE